MTEKELLAIMRPEGDLREGFREFLNRYVPKNAMFAEIGCFAGAATEMILDHCTEGFVYAIDSWNPEYYDKQWDMVEVEKCFDRLRPRYKNLEKIKLSSLDAVSLFSTVPTLNVVYIDAEHDYENVRADIKAWSPLVTEYGIISGHDFVKSWPGVLRAVNELCLPYTTFRDSTWVHIKGSYNA